jgi:excisionase family DNA binding protein
VVAYLTIQEVAEQMRCEHRTVRRAIKRGELQAAMIGGKWIIRENDVNAWFQSRCPSGVTSAAAAQLSRGTASARTPRPDGAGSVSRLRAIEGKTR